jgi:hypothetical protein
LPNFPRREYLLKFLGCLLSKRGSTSEQRPHGAQIVLGKHISVLGQQNDDGRDLDFVRLVPCHYVKTTYQKQCIDLVVLNGLQSSCKLKFRQDNDPVAAIDTGVADDDQAIYVGHGKQAKHILSVVCLVPQILDEAVSVWFVKGADLHYASQQRQMKLRLADILVFAMTFLCEIITPFCIVSVGI